MNKGFKKLLIASFVIGAGVACYMTWKNVNQKKKLDDDFNDDEDDLTGSDDGSGYNEDVFNVDGDMHTGRTYVPLSSFGRHSDNLSDLSPVMEAPDDSIPTDLDSMNPLDELDDPTQQGVYHTPSSESSFSSKEAPLPPLETVVTEVPDSIFHDPDLDAVDSMPEFSQSESVVTDSMPEFSQPEPVVADSMPEFSQPEPVVADSMPEFSQPEPVVADSMPEFSQPEPSNMNPNSYEIPQSQESEAPESIPAYQQEDQQTATLDTSTSSEDTRNTVPFSYQKPKPMDTSDTSDTSDLDASSKESVASIEDELDFYFSTDGLHSQPDKEEPSSLSAVPEIPNTAEATSSVDYSQMRTPEPISSELPQMEMPESVSSELPQMEMPEPVSSELPQMEMPEPVSSDLPQMEMPESVSSDFPQMEMPEPVSSDLPQMEMPEPVSSELPQTESGQSLFAQESEVRSVEELMDPQMEIDNDLAGGENIPPIDSVYPDNQSELIVDPFNNSIPVDNLDQAEELAQPEPEDAPLSPSPMDQAAPDSEQESTYNNITPYPSKKDEFFEEELEDVF